MWPRSSADLLWCFACPRLMQPATLCLCAPVVQVVLAASQAMAALVSAAPAHKMLDVLTLMLPPHVPITGDTHDLEVGGSKLVSVCRCVQLVAHDMQASLRTTPCAPNRRDVLHVPLGTCTITGYSMACCRPVVTAAFDLNCMQADELAVRVPRDLMPGLKAMYNHVRADVRKSSVFAIAEIWVKLGSDRCVHLDTGSLC